MKKIYSVTLTKVFCFVCFLTLLAGVRFTANAQNHTSAQNHPGQVTASRNITAPDGRHLAFSVSGKMPAGATVSATSVQRTAPQGKQLKGAYDITVKNGNAKWQPQAGQPATVSITDPSFTDGQMLDVWHEGAGGLEFVATVSPVNGKITFPAQSFSVYIVTETGGNARLAVTFVQADGQMTLMVKQNDIDPNDPNDTLFNKILYDLGAGEYDQDLIFRGWYKAGKNYTYTIADAAHALTIEGVRAEVKNVLNSGVTEGDTIYFYALIYKSFNVTYVDTNNAVLSSENYLEQQGVTEIEYTVLQNFTLDDHHSLLGWYVHPDYINNVEGYNSEKPVYPNDTTIVITGDVVFTPYLPAGHWLIFDENGKGGRYNSPQFVLAGNVTHKPCDDSEMTRYGYKFDKWYKNKNCTSDSVFTFGGELEANTTIYANWTPNKNAPYMIIFWTQNLDRTGYEVKNSYVVDNGMVGQNIPYETVDNGDEDYARHAATFGNGTLSTNVNAQTYNEVLGHYRGFCLTEGSKNQSVTITPEGDAVLNLYYDRIEYNFKFYLYRDGTQNNRYDYANNSGSGSSLNDLVTWHSNQTAHPSVNGYTIQSETVNGRTYYYFVLQAFYGEEISSKWPTYDKITGANNREAVSYVMMVGTRLKPNPTGTGSGTVKGIITVMNENILGATNNANGNYVIIRFPDSYYNWRYHLWFEVADGETYTTTREYNGKKYYEETVLVVRSSNTTVANQNEPKYLVKPQKAFPCNR